MGEGGEPHSSPPCFLWFCGGMSEILPATTRISFLCFPATSPPLQNEL